MVGKRPEEAGAAPRRPLEGEAGTLGLVEPPFARETLIPASQLAPLLEAHMGQLKAQIRSELSDDIAKLPTRWEFFGAIIAGIIAAFGIFALMGDRIENAVGRSATLSETLTKVERQGEDNTKALEALKDERLKSAPSPRAKQDAGVLRPAGK